MPLRTELKQIVDDQRVTALLQALIACQSLQTGVLTHGERQHLEAFDPFMVTTLFKESAVVFTGSGHYADLATVFSLLNEVVIQPDNGVLQ